MSNALPSGDVAYYFTIEGLGKTSVTSGSGDSSKLWRFSTKAVPSSVDVDGLVKPWWTAGADGLFEFSRLVQQIDFRSGRFTIENAAFMVQPDDDDSDVDLKSELLLPSGRGSKLGDLDLSSGSLTATATTVALSATGQGGKLIYYKREAIQLGTEVGSSGVYNGCKRQLHGTRAELATVGRFGEDLEVRTRLDPRQGRRVTLYALSETASSLADEIPIWAGVFHKAGRTIPDVIQVECNGLTWLLRNLRLSPRPWFARVSVANYDDDGLLQLVFEPLEREGEVARSHPWSAPAAPVVGDAVYVKVGEWAFEALYEPQGVWVTWDASVPLFDGARPQRGDIKAGDIAQEFFATSPGAPSPVSSPAAGDLPLGSPDRYATDVMLDLLHSTWSGANGVRDLGVVFGLGLPEAMIDSTQFERVGYRLGDRLQMDRTFIGTEDASGQARGEVALDKLEKELLAPNEMAFSVTLDGRLGLVSFVYVSDPDDVEVVVDDDDLLAIVTWSSGDDKVLDGLKARYRRRVDGSSFNVDVNNGFTQHRTLGADNREEVDCGGWSNFAKAYDAAQTRLTRWARAFPRLTIEVPFSKNAQMGKVIRLTCNHVLDVESNTVVEGVSNARIVVYRKEIDTAADRFVYHGLHVDLDQRFGRIGPAAQVKSVPASDTVEVEDDAFVPSVGGLYDADLTPFAVGDACKLVDQYGSTREAGLEIKAIDAANATITFTAAPSVTPVVGNVVVHDDYAAASEEQRSAWIWISNGDGLVDGELGYNYEA